MICSELNLKKALLICSLENDSKNRKLLLELGKTVLQISKEKKRQLSKIKNDFDDET